MYITKCKHFNNPINKSNELKVISNVLIDPCINSSKLHRKLTVRQKYFLYICILHILIMHTNEIHACVP